MKNVLVTRPAQDADELVQQIELLGMTAIRAPLMSVEFLPTPPDLPQNISEVAFTSANGVRAFLKTSSADQMRAFAIGPTTAKVAKEAGFEIAGVAENSVESMASLIAQKTDGLVYHPVGRHEAGDLVADLQSRGVNAVKGILYETKAAEALPDNVVTLIKEGRLTWVTLLSPRTAKIFKSLLATHKLEAYASTFCIAAFSPAVAKVFDDLELKKITVADAPILPQLIDILRADTHVT